MKERNIETSKKLKKKERKKERNTQIKKKYKMKDMKRKEIKCKRAIVGL